MRTVKPVILAALNFGSSLKTGPARPGHVKIALDITAVDIDSQNKGHVKNTGFTVMSLLELKYLYLNHMHLYLLLST